MSETKKTGDVIKEMWSKVQELLGEQIKPRLLVGGKTGVGKSSLLNAILGKDVYEVGVIPTTKNNDEQIWESKGGDIVVIDVPGFGEANAPEFTAETFKGSYKGSYEENIKRLAELDAHVFLLILKCDDRALEKEEKFIENWNSNEILQSIPKIMVCNQIDKMKPTREWDPKSLNLKTPVTEKEKNIRQFIDYISSLPKFRSISDKNRIVPVSAGESFNDPLQYGIEDLKNKIYEALPDSAKTIFARSAELKNQEAGRIVKYYASAGAGAVAVNFLPASDALILAPIQIAMIIHLGKLHKIEITISTASGLLTSLGLSFAGRFTAQTILSFFPGIKNLVGPGLAFGLTYSMGMAINELFTEGKITATKEEFENLANKYEKQGKAEAENYKS